MKRRKTLLILAIICFAVAGAAGLELGSMVYDCYNPTSGSSYEVEIFGPKEPNVDWEHHNRFKFKPWKEPINI